jgi:hypothetical protein
MRYGKPGEDDQGTAYEDLELDSMHPETHYQVNYPMSYDGDVRSHAD